MTATTNYFEFVGPTGSKFWEITVDAAAHTVRFGKVGAKGQSKTKVFDSPDAARADADKLIRSKVAKGYVEVALTAVSTPAHDPEIATLVAELLADVPDDEDPDDLPRPRPPASDA